MYVDDKKGGWKRDMSKRLKPTTAHRSTQGGTSQIDSIRLSISRTLIRYLRVYLNAGAAVIWGIIPRLIARFIVVVNAYVNAMVSPAAV